jgi:DNA modification methylase
MTVELILGDCLEVMKGLPDKSVDAVITDPPFNIGYGYSTHIDNLGEEEYLALLSVIKRPAVVIHYPEESINILPKVLGRCDEVVQWVYSSRLAKQHRTITFWGISPDFKKVREPYKIATLKDKRNQHKINPNGRAVKDWWSIPYVNNMNKEKTEHPCQMPTEVMKRIILISTNPGDTILDPFMGSGTTGVACVQTGRNFIGIEIDEDYFKIAEQRIKEAQMQPRLL